MSRRRFMTDVGDIRLPSDYQRVEYLESTGTQYINTNYIPNKENYTLEIKWQFLQYGSEHYILGTRDSNMSHIFAIQNFWNSKTIYIANRNDDVSVFDGYDFSIPFNTDIHTSILNKNFGILDNIEKRKESLYITNRNLYLFNCNGDTGICYGRIYYCNITYNDKLYCTFIPCYRKSDHKPGMYDIVNDVFYINQGTGEFILGPNV